MALDPNINRIKFHRTKTAGAAPTTANVSEGELAFNLTDKTIYTNDGTNIVRIGDPDRLLKYEVLGPSSARVRNMGAIYAAGTVTGALVLSLPKLKFNSTTMMKIRLDGFNYSQGASWSLELAGYNFTGSTWHNTMANLTSGGPLTPFIRGLANDQAAASIKFGATTDRNLIVIGAIDTVWQYPDIQITEALLGHVNSTNGGWDSDWKLEFVSSQTILDSYTYNTGQGQPILYGLNRVINAEKLFFPRNINGVAFDGSSNITVYDSTKLPLTGGNVTGNLIVGGSLTANTNIQNTTGNNLGFLNAGSALGINVGNILVSNSYSDVTKVPTNGAYLKGGLDADNVIRGAIPTAYTTLQAVGVGTSVPFRLKDGNIGSTYGFSPVLNWNTQTSGGYRQVNHIGTYRPTDNWNNSGVYIATGGNDNYSTEAFLFQNGRTISNTAGDVRIVGVSDRSNGIDATPGSLYGDSSNGWRKLGVATIPQAGRNVTLEIYGGQGFNAGSAQQARTCKIILKTGNGTPANGINTVVEYMDGNNLLSNLGVGVANVCTVPLADNQYEVWINTGGYLSATLVPIVGAECEWEPAFTPNATATKPSGAFDAVTFTIAVANVSNVASANKLTTPRNINGVAFDGTANINVQPVSIAIPGGSDLNTYLSEGFYFCDQNATAATISNTPIASTAFSLLVEKTAGAKQTWTAYSPDGNRTFIRTIYAGTPGGWREVVFTNTPTFTGTANFMGAVNIGGITNTAGLINSGTLRSSGTTYLGNALELGTVGNVSPALIDFHSGPSDIDFDARISSAGGTAAIGNGALTYTAASHTFTGRIDGGLISGSTGLGIANSTSSVQAGLSLYGGASTGKPPYGIMFSGSANSGLGTHGDVTGAWGVYLTCATAGAEKRGWIFQRSNDSTNVASISTNGILSTTGSIGTISDNTMINVGNDNNLALVKKAGGTPFIGVGLNTPFRVSRGNLAAVDPSNTFTDLFTVSTAGVVTSAGGFSGNLTGNADSATKWANSRTISITGDATWSTSIDGSGNATGALTLANSGVTAGAYKAVTVDSKGRVTAGATYNVGLVSASANNIATNQDTDNSNTYLNVTEILNGTATTSVIASQRVIGTGTVTVNSDAYGNLRIDGAQNITGNAATSDKWSAARTITFSGDTSGSVSIDGSSNVSGTLTTRGATTAQTGIVQLNDTATSTSTTQALTANQGRVISNKVNSMMQVAMYDETSGHQGLGDNPTLTNIYGYPITVLFSVSYNSGSNPPYAITLTNPAGNLSFTCPGNVPVQVPAGHKYQLVHVGGGGRNNITGVIIIR